VEIKDVIIVQRKVSDLAECNVMNLLFIQITKDLWFCSQTPHARLQHHAHENHELTVTYWNTSISYSGCLHSYLMWSVLHPRKTCVPDQEMHWLAILETTHNTVFLLTIIEVLYGSNFVQV